MRDPCRLGHTNARERERRREIVSAPDSAHWGQGAIGGGLRRILATERA